MAGLPARQVPVDELRDLLSAPDIRPQLRDAVWADLVRRARANGATATLVCVGVALPVLYSICRRLGGNTVSPRRRGGSEQRAQSLTTPLRSDQSGVCEDLESSVLAGFLAEVPAVDLRRPGIARRLTTAGDDAGRAFLRQARRAPVPHANLLTAFPPAGPAEHPDLVLARAVADHALTHGEAVLVGATRLEPTRIADIARAHGRSERQIRAARVRAERKLAAYLRDEASPDGAPGDTRTGRREP